MPEGLHSQKRAAEFAGGRWPDFLLIGAPKAGSTALYKALSRHPRIFVSTPKQPDYFMHTGQFPGFGGPGAQEMASQVVWERDSYLALFADCPAGHRAGEASIGYLHDPAAPSEVYSAIPAARLITVLRQPVDRAYSQWLHLRQEGREELDFERAWHAGPQRHGRGWPPLWLYRERGFYGEQIERWLRYFPREQLLILFYDDWLSSPDRLLTQICSHLDVEDFVDAEITRENVSSRQPRWKWLHHRMVSRNPLRNWAQRHLPLWARDAVTDAVQRLNLRAGPPLNPHVRERLTKDFHDDITKLEALTGRDLGHWKTPPER